MPALSFFADAEDVGLLVEHLNADPDLAFLVPLDHVEVPRELFGISPAGFSRNLVEERRWKAVHTVPSLPDGKYSLWHTPTGELREMEQSRRLVIPPGTPIPDPWSGWSGLSIVEPTTVRPRVEAGLGHHGIIRLQLWTRHRAYSAVELATEKVCYSFWTEGHDYLVTSNFQWTGSGHRPAPKETTRWWNRLKGWLNRSCVKLNEPGGQQAFYAFPSALRLLQSGIKYYSRSWDLDASIQASRLP